MTIARKLHLLILVVIPGMLAQVMLGIFQSNRAADAAGYSAANTIPSVLTLNAATDAIYAIRLHVARFMIDPSRRGMLSPYSAYVAVRTQHVKNGKDSLAVRNSQTITC
nr:hypothetical protein [Herbaspirillum sp. ASV7]